MKRFPHTTRLRFPLSFPSLPPIALHCIAPWVFFTPLGLGLGLGLALHFRFSWTERKESQRANEPTLSLLSLCLRKERKFQLSPVSGRRFTGNSDLPKNSTLYKTLRQKGKKSETFTFILKLSHWTLYPIPTWEAIYFEIEVNYKIQIPQKYHHLQPKVGKSKFNQL